MKPTPHACPDIGHGRAMQSIQGNRVERVTSATMRAYQLSRAKNKDPEEGGLLPTPFLITSAQMSLQTENQIGQE